MRMAPSARVFAVAGALLIAILAVRALPTFAQQDEDFRGGEFRGPRGGGGPDGPGGGGRGGGNFDERTISVQGTERSYGIHVPANVANPAAVVFLFHGGGGRPQAIARRSGMTELSDEKGFIAVFPLGEARDEGARGGTWNVGGAQSAGSADDVAFVKAILADIARTNPVDPTRIYATGISMGGVFSYRLACEMSDTFAAVAPVAATMVEPSCQPSSPVAIFHIHGADDDRIPLKGGHGARTASERSWPAPQDGIAHWRKFDACGAKSTKSKDGDASCTTYDGCTATVEYCVISGEGHTWPDNASDRIWSFFAAHPKPQQAAR